MSFHYYGYWEYWELYHKVTFDGVNKLILINDGVTSLDVKNDVYSSWKEWLLLNSLTNTQYQQAFSVIGGEPISDTEKIDATFFLINNWKIKPYPGQYSISIVGNLFTDDGSSILAAADIVDNIQNNISLNLRTSAVVRLVTATVSGSSSSGSVYPADTVFTASLVESQSNQLSNINDKTISNETLLISQSAMLTELRTLVDEIYSIHGLKQSYPVKITPTSRIIIGGTLTQDITTTGTGSNQETIVTRTA